VAPIHRAAPVPAPRRLAATVVAVLSVAAMASVASVVVSAVVSVVRASEASAAVGCDGPVTEGNARVTVVVDPGEVGAPSSMCLVVPAGTTGSQVLARRAAELGVAPPRYAGSGLLCALDAHPATGCGDRNGTGFRYWAYFNGTSGSWVYGSYNPFIRRVSDGDVEGWRFVDGAGNGTDPPPRMGAPRPDLAPLVASTPTSTPSPTPSAGNTAPTTGGLDDPDTPVSSDGGVVDASPVDGDAGADDSVELAVAPMAASDSSRPWVPVAIVGMVVAALAAGAIARSRT